MLIPRVRWLDEDGTSISVAMEDIGIEVFSICSLKKHGAKVLLSWIKNRRKQIKRGEEVVQVVSSELIERRKFLKRFRKVHTNRRKVNEGRRREEEEGTTVKSNCGSNESMRRGGFDLKVWVHCRG